MSKDVSIFTSDTALAPSGKRVTALSQKLATSRTSTSTTRRIQANINGTFKKSVNGDQIGEIIRGEFNAVIVNMLTNVSRIYYKDKFDPSKEATLPNCWSNQGDKPEAAASDPQSPTCSECAMNIKGSGETGGRACRFQRRVSLMLEGDESGTIYQFNIPAKSLFGKGVGNLHPFESYVKFLVNNALSPDSVVTTVAFNPNAETMELVFSPVREVTDAEFDLVLKAQENPESKMYTQLTVGQVDKVEKQPAIQAPVAEAKPVVEEVVEEPIEEVVAEVVEEPKKRSTKKDEPEVGGVDMASIIENWGSDLD